MTDIAIADAKIGQQTNSIPTLDPKGPGEDIDVLLSISRKLDALAQPVQGATATPTGVFDSQVIDLLGQIEKNTSLLVKRGTPAASASASPAMEAPRSASGRETGQKGGFQPSTTGAKAGAKPKPKKGQPDKAGGPTTQTTQKAPAKSAETDAQTDKAGAAVKNTKAKPGSQPAKKPVKGAPATLQTPAPIQTPETKAETTPKFLSRSAQAREEQRQKKTQAELRNGITKSLRDGLVSVGAKTFEKAGEIAKGETAQDAIGTAVGGPIYSAAKELHGAAKDILDVDPESMTGKALEKIKGKFRKGEPEKPAKQNPKGPMRDEHGRFLTKEERQAKELEDLTKEFSDISRETGKSKRLTKEVKEIRTDLERTTRINRKFQRDSERTEDDQVETADALYEGTEETHDILEDNDEKQSKRDRRLRRTIMLMGMKGGRGLPGMGGGRRGGVRGGGTRGTKGPKKSRKPSPRRSPRVSKKAGMLSRLGKLGRLGRIGKIGGMLAGGAGLLGGVGSLVGGFFGRGSEPDITDQAVDAAEAKRTTKTRKPRKAPKLAVGQFNKAPVVTEGVEAVTKRTAKKTTAKAGLKLGGKAALKMGGRAASLGLRALGPAATLAFMGYDAFSGWKDKGMQAEAFDLKEGQEATTGQKLSAATANVLDMGGLGTGMLNMFGADVNTGDLAKKIHEVGSVVTEVITNPVKAVSGALGSFFGWGKKDEKEKAQEAKPMKKPTEPMLVSQAVTTPPETIQPAPIPHRRRTVEAMEVPGKAEAGKDSRFPGEMKGTTGKDYSPRMVKLLEEIAGQGKVRKKDGRFQKPDSVIPTEYDDTILTLMAHDRL